MDTAFAPEDIAFRDEVAAFFDSAFDKDIESRLSDSDPAVFQPAIIEWQKRLFDRGWIAPGWPVEYGGTGWDASKAFIFETERASRGIGDVTPFGLKMVGPVLYEFGTDEQKERFLPKI
ncbi:MAG: pimeloyl-CoA dehydrogenase large subunit, partial [Halieaceae bacterium]|nr:pimeloyl-CoA dehydrogenase large subunit [Halieaceae bacterium]